MPSGPFPPLCVLNVTLARLRVERSRVSLAGHLDEVERLGECLVAGTQSLERREAVLAADEAAGLLSLAADALRCGLGRLAAIEDGDLGEELSNVAAAARAGVP